MSGGVALVARPKQSQQDVDIRQIAIHSSSQSSRTRSLVITGNSSDASKDVGYAQRKGESRRSADLFCRSAVLGA
jgi:hypothetical protein